MSNSVRPHRQQPTRPRHPWDSPGKNTGVSCHFLLQCMKVKSESEVAQSCLTLINPMDCSLPGSSVHCRRSIFISSIHFLGKSTGVGCHCLLHLMVINWTIIWEGFHDHFTPMLLGSLIPSSGEDFADRPLNVLLLD